MRKLLVAVSAVILLSGCSSTETPRQPLRGVAVAPPPVDALGTASVKLSWNGIGTVFGTVAVENQRGEGTLSVLLPDRTVPCRGAWLLSHGAYGSDVAPEGTWTLKCPDNLSARGSFRSDIPWQVNGAGSDSQGRRITLSMNG